MDESALRRAKQRISEAAEGRPHPADVGAALERSRAQVEALAATAAELEAAIPAQVGHAVRDGLRVEVLPVARHIAEIRGLFNQAIRRLERIESDLLAERKARVDDLALLVDLVTSGWRGVDARLLRLEDAHAETAACLAGLVESLGQDDAVAPAVSDSATPDADTPDPLTSNPAVPDPAEPVPAEPVPAEPVPAEPVPAGPAPFGPRYPAQGSQAEAIVERAGADNGADRAAAAA